MATEKILYLDCSSGISGDMFTGAMLGLGADAQKLRAALASLALDDFTVAIEQTQKSGIAATKFDVRINRHVHAHRHLADIIKLIDDSPLEERVKALAKKIFGIVARAEGRVHGVDPSEVHFHEVGAADSIADIVSAAVCLTELAPDRILVSPLCVGGGTVRCAHGLLPVPAPATAEILREAGLPFYTAEPQDGELVTPTGAAIAAAVCDTCGPMPAMTVDAIGCGAGTKELSRPNLLRAFLGHVQSAETPADTVEVLETNLDDTTGEALGACLEALMRAGAKDAFFTPVYGKKGRPAYLLTVLCDQPFVHTAARILFERTGSIGLRLRTQQRVVMRREIKSIATRFGEIPVKFSTFEDVVKYKPEADAVEEAARRNKVAPSAVYAEVAALLSRKA